MKKIELLGIKIASILQKEIIPIVIIRLQEKNYKKPFYITTPNPEIIVVAQKNAELKNAVNESDLAIPDGVGLVWASRFLGTPLRERVTGIDLMLGLCKEFAAKKISVGLLGAQDGVAKAASVNLKKIYPQLEIAFAQSEIPKEKLKCDFLFVAYGAPKQEKFIYEQVQKIKNKKNNQVNFKGAMGVGGAFDFLSGRVTRAPVFIQKLNLEWLWRLIIEPWRWRRIVTATLYFPWLVLLSKINKST